MSTPYPSLEDALYIQENVILQKEFLRGLNYFCKQDINYFLEDISLFSKTAISHTSIANFDNWLKSYVLESNGFISVSELNISKYNSEFISYLEEVYTSQEVSSWYLMLPFFLERIIIYEKYNSWCPISIAFVYYLWNKIKDNYNRTIKRSK